MRGSVGAFVDITQRKLAEQRSEAVLREISHRFANPLGVIRAMAQLTLRSSVPLEGRLAAFESRLRGLGQSVRLIGQSDWDRVPLAGWLIAAWICSAMARGFQWPARPWPFPDVPRSAWAWLP